MILRIEHLVKRFGGLVAVDDLELNVYKGKINALIGPNGSGKTTTLNTLATHEIIRKGIVLVPEGRKIFPKLTVRSNLEMGAYTRKGAIEHSIEEIFTYFPRLKERMNQLAGTLSGGEQQMLAIGRGLMAEPKLLMLDEPSMGLAPVIVEEMFTIINRIHKERRLPILLVEQNAYMALETCDYCYVIENGEIVLEGTSEQMEASEEIKKVYLGG